MTAPLVDLNGRVRDRVRETRQRRVKMMARVLVAVTVLIVLGFVATTSPLFSVRRVEVTGNQVVAADAIKQAAEIRLGVPLAQVDTAAMAKRVSAVPGVGRGDVTVALPDVLKIRVTERALAFVVAADGGFAWIDPTGIRFSQSSERPKGVPLAEASVTDQEVLADVATVAGALPARLTAKVDHITASTRDSITIVTTDRTRIVWGSSDSSSLKGQVADTITRVQPTCKVVDVSSPSLPTTAC